MGAESTTVGGDPNPWRPGGGQRGRHVAIAEQVIRRGSVTIEELVEATGVSMMTIYRDISALEEAGLVQRHRGRVNAIASGLHEAGAGFRLEQQVSLKQDMAGHVAKLIKPGSSLMLDDSTSGVYVLRAIRGVLPLTVITNSLLVGREVETSPDVKLFISGGEYQPWAEALMGPSAVAMLSGMRSDICLLSASGIADGECYHPYQDVVEVKRAMIKSARMSILMLDHSKFSRRALHSFAKLTDFDLVVVDSATSEEDRQMLRDYGANVDVAEPAK